MKRELYKVLNNFFLLECFIILMVGITDIFLWKQKVVRLDMSFLGLVLGLSILSEKKLYRRLNIGTILLLSAVLMYVPNKLLEVMQVKILNITKNNYLILMVVVFIILIILWFMKYWYKTKKVKP